MNKYIKSIILATAVAPCLTGCLEEYTPTDVATKEQLEQADKSGIANAIAAYMTTFSTDNYYDVGFAGFGVWRDAMTADLPVAVNTYDYFTYFNYQNYLGDYALQSLFWQRYYYLIQKSNQLLNVTDPESTDENERAYMGNALAYRAMAYLDMARMYEYRPTGVARLDQEAESRGIYGLTVPIVTETTTEAESRNNPRVPFWHLYRFILNDLNRAETYLADTRTATSKIQACLGVVYGLKARFWLELASRFERHDQDLQTLIQNENNENLSHLAQMGITSAKECYRNAAEYARLAINQGFTPVTETQWFDARTGFNTPNNSWMWCISISPDDPAASSATWQSFVSFMAPEATWGIATSEYNGYRMIDARLFGTIPDNDWRKTTWIAPDDVADEDAFNTKYARGTSMSYNEWKSYGAYCGIKFHPNGGDRTTSANGNAVSIPLMRVEEMYLIEAEANAQVAGYGAGKQLLETFLNTYRYKDGSYSCPANSLEELVEEIFAQRRIELWGEGLILWDYRRLEHPIVRGYPGTNHPQPYWFNSYPDAVAPWTTIYIPDSEKNYNQAVILNPDPSDAIPAWTN